MALGNPEVSPPNVAFASTGYGPLWAPAVSSWLRVVGYTARSMAIQQVGQIGGAGVTDRMYTHAAENKLVEEMLANDPPFTHIFMTESDMILPHDAITKLMALDADMASGVYFLRADDVANSGQPCLYKRARISRDDPNYKKPGSEYMHVPVTLFETGSPFRVDCAGLGCLLLKRKVFETLEFPWFDLKAGGYGSDIYFSKHAKDAGLELWVDPTVLCGQIDYYMTDIQDWEWQIKNNPEFPKRGFIIGYGQEKAGT